MSDAGNERVIQSSLPAPPMAYINLYTDENVRRGKVPKPPPLPPSHDVYSMFGTEFHSDDAIIRPLESQGIRRLYPNNLDHRRELKKLNHSILANYLDLLEIMILAPDSSKRQEKIQDISLLFIHIHHLINEFRPHQARETLRVMMEVQKRQAYDTCERLQKHLEKCLDIIKTALTDLPTQHDPAHKLSLPLDKSKSRKRKGEAIAPSDRDLVMCDIADNL